MLTPVAVLIVLLLPVAGLVALMLGVEARQRAQARVAAHQIRITDAVHAELGAIVSPVVEKPAFGPWRVVFAVPQGRVREIGRLMAITERVLGSHFANVQVVFTRRASVTRSLAA